jgi:predicted DNA-binding ribbon-helix-helix protein
MTSPYHPPVKRSLSIAGHQTSISLEPLFWEMLKSAALREGLAVAALVARIDAEQARADNALTDTEAAELTARIRIEVQRADAAEAKSARLEAALREVLAVAEMGVSHPENWPQFTNARNALSGQEG